LFFVLCSVIWTKSNGQNNQLSVGVQAPLYYTISYEEQLYKKLHLNFQFGWLDQPFESIIIKESKRRGLNSEIADITAKQFSIGYAIQPMLKFKFKHFYVGALYSYTVLKATDLPAVQLANIYNIDLSGYQGLLFANIMRDVALQSKLHLPGLFIGKEFKIVKTNLLLGIEIGFQKIVGSSSKLTYGSDQAEVPFVGNLVNEDLNEYYVEEGNVPTLSLSIVYKFKKSINGLIKGITSSED